MADALNARGLLVCYADYSLKGGNNRRDPELADRVAVRTDKGLEYAVQRILEAAKWGLSLWLGIPFRLDCET